MLQCFKMPEVGASVETKSEPERVMFAKISTAALGGREGTRTMRLKVDLI